MAGVCSINKTKELKTERLKWLEDGHNVCILNCIRIRATYIVSDAIFKQL